MNVETKTVVTPEFVATLKTKNLSEIAAIIRKDWGVKVNYAAQPYLSAMQCLSSITDKYGFDDARSIVLYFLGNAGAWRGEVAKAVKAELKKRVK